ncbi:MAG: PAS domain-containing protein, partial [Verrucomicrobiota bacterium]
MVPQPSHSPFQKQALIVLPDPALRNLVSDLLLRRNYRVSAVGSLKDGVEAFQHQSLIITTPQADASLREGMIAWVREQTPPSVEQPYVLALGERDQAQLTTEANRDWDELITLPLNPLHFNARLEAIENWIAVRSVEPSMTDSKPRSSLSGAKATQPPTTSPKATASFQALLDGNPKPMAVFDSNLRYLAVNERWKREFHLEEELLPGKKHSDYFPDLSDVWYSACRDALRGKKKNCEEDSWLQSNGKRTKLAWSLEPWSDTSGEVSGLLITCTPQQKQATPSRSASPSSHLIGQAFLSNESIPFLLLDLDGKILESNSAAASFSSTGFA